MEDLEGMTWSMNEDRWRRNRDEVGVFSVKTAYKALVNLGGPEELWGVAEKRVFEKLWKSPAPSKVVAFAWKVLHNRVPTMLNLALRNVLSPEDSTRCVLSNEGEESPCHLFLHCKVASVVWLRLMTWVEWHFLIPPNLFVHWECWSGRRVKKNCLRGLWLIWQTTVWVLWKARNDKIFKGINYEPEELVDEIKVLSWRWMLQRMNIPVCLYDEWCWNPSYCLGRVNTRV